MSYLIGTLTTILLDAGTGFWIDRRFVRNRILSFINSTSTALIADF